MSQFDKLIGELDQLGKDQETMTKALPADDGKDEEKIQAAAAEGGLGEGGAAAGGEGGGGQPGGEGGEGGEQVTKSFQLTLEDGTVLEAVDGTEMVKALANQLTTHKANTEKVLGQAVDLIKGQNGLIKSLQERVEKLSGEGRGRKAVISIAEKPAPTASTLVKSQTEGITPELFFAKALTAQREGRINGAQIAEAEACLNRGVAIPTHIVTSVMAGA